MIAVLVDHNMEGHAALLWSTLTTSDWRDLELFRFITFAEVGLPLATTDRGVWQFV